MPKCAVQDLTLNVNVLIYLLVLSLFGLVMFMLYQHLVIKAFFILYKIKV